MPHAYFLLFAGLVWVLAACHREAFLTRNASQILELHLLEKWGDRVMEDIHMGPSILSTAHLDENTNVLGEEFLPGLSMISLELLVDFKLIEGYGNWRIK